MSQNHPSNYLSNRPSLFVATSTLARRLPTSRFAAIALGLAVALGAGRAAFAAGVIDHVPADAMVVIKVNDLAATSGKIAKLAQDLGVDMFQPKLADPLGSLKTEMKIDKGLNDHGEMAIVMLDPAKHGNGGPDASTLILIPTDDFAALTANLDQAKADGDVTSFVSSGGVPMFIADWGDGYAAQSPSRDLIAKKPTEFVKPSARAVTQMKDNDIALFANIPAVREQATSKIEGERAEKRQQFIDQIGKGAGPNGGANPEAAKFKPVAGAAFDQAINAAEAFLRDADAATVGISFPEGGVRYNVVADFKEGSYLGGLAAKFKGSEQPLVSGLPSTKYLMFGGAVNSPEAFAKLIDDIATPIVQAIPADAGAGAGTDAVKITPELVTGYISGIKAYSAEVETMSFGMVTPQGAIGQEGIFQIVSSTHGNAEKIVSTLRDFNEKNSALTNSLMSAGQGFKIEQAWTNDAKKIGDVSFDSVTTNILGDTPAANQVRQQMQFMYGGKGAEAFVGKVGDKDVLTLMGVSDEVAQQAIAAAKANEAPLASLAPVQGVAKQLPGKHIIEVYVALDEIATTALRAANQMGFFQGSVQLPPDLPPIGFVVSTDGPAIEGSAFVPSDLMQALVSAGMQLSQRRGGGGGGL